MRFEFARNTLRRKISMVVVGTTMAVALAVGGIGELLLHGIASAKSSQSRELAALERMVGQGGAVLSPVTARDGSVVGVLVMRSDAGAAVLPASFDGQGLVVRASEQVTAGETESFGGSKILLLLAGVFVCATAGLAGTRIANGLLEPLGQLEKDVAKLARGETDVSISALERKDEIGGIARSAVKIREELVAYARLKAEMAEMAARALLDAQAPQKVELVRNLKAIWDDLRFALRDAGRLLVAETRVVASHWNTWWHEGLGIPRRA